jgi:hypothetical protein
MVPIVVEAVRLSDAQRNCDFAKTLDIVNEQMAYTAKKENEAYVADVLPEFYKDLLRLQEMLGTGRVTPKYFDLASTEGPLRR